MDLKLLVFFTIICGSLFVPAQSFAQQKLNLDSMRQERQRVIDSTRAVQKKYMDSLKAVRQHRSDSLAAIRAYKSSKRYQDSVSKARQSRLDSIKQARTAYFDSIKAERQRVIDSTTAVRKRYSDSLKQVQQRRADSLGAIRKYRESKRYKDSVAITRQMRMDSLAAARKARNDSAVASRKAVLDSAKAARKKHNDSLTAERKKFTDSLQKVRKARTDSLAKVKADREKLNLAKQKLKEDKMKLAFELKVKKKREAWSNEKMLKKRWSLKRRLTQNMFTRYNYYFNADRKMDEAIDNMLRSRKDNYDSLIALFPFDPDRDSSLLASDMDSIIQKASVGIQIHDPRTKWGDDLYLLLGQAFYYRGNYEQASNSFRYIISMNQQLKAQEQKEAARKGKKVKKDLSVVEPEPEGKLGFLKHRKANNEAILWMARVKTEEHKANEAESILDLLEGDKNMPEDLKGRVALEKAYINLERNNKKAVSENLAVVADDSKLPGWIRLRASFLNGQLLQELGDYEGAAARYEQVIALHPKIEMDFYARRNLAYSLMEQGGTQDMAAASLKQLLRDGKYANYHEQVYYVLGRLAANSNNPGDAITYLKKSIESPKSTKKQKALSFAALGNAYYGIANYTEAKLAYDSAAYLAKFAPDDPMVAVATKRSQMLDLIVGPLTTIRTNDSLLALAALPEREQRAAARRHIRMLEKKIQDSIARAESGGGPGLVDVSNDGGVSSWYFANPVLMQQGFNEFKRKWGSRPNVDNWRRASGSTFASSARIDQGSDEGGEGEDQGLPTEESLMAFIPNTPQKQDSARRQILNAYVSLADAYINKLEDFAGGTRALDSLDRRYPSHDRQAEAIFLRYTLALKQNQLDQAQGYSQRLMKDYAGTSWAKAVTPAEDSEGLLASNVPVSRYYDETYGLMMQRHYSAVLQRSRDGQRFYKDARYNNRFRIMEAIALAGAGYFNQADTLLTDFISKHPTDTLRGWADAVMSYIKAHRPAPATDSTAATMVTQGGAASLDSSLAKAPRPVDSMKPKVVIPATYTYKPKEEHYFIFYVQKMNSKALGVRAGLTDFGKLKFTNQNLSANLEVLKEDLGLVVVKSFPSAAHAKIFMNSARSTEQLFREYKPNEFELMIISAENMLKLKADKDMQAYKKFYQSNYK